MKPFVLSAALTQLRFLAAVIALLVNSASWGQPSSQGVPVVAAENFYGDIAMQLADGYADVLSIVSNPNQDPHLFEASPSIARDTARARIVIYNGADYDPWMPKLLSASRTPKAQVIVVADLVHRKPGENPHLWYDPRTMPAAAKGARARIARG